MDSHGSHQEKKEVRGKEIHQIEDDIINGGSKVVLVGEAGIGKTWLAKEVSDRVTNDKEGSCYLALWLHLNKKFDERSLYQNLAAQLSLSSEYEESDDDDDDEEEERDGKRTEKQREGDKLRKKETELKEKDEELKKKMIEELKMRNPAKEENNPFEGEKKSCAGGKKYLLLVLDDEGSVTDEETVMKKLKLEEFLEPHGTLKILITRRGKGDENRGRVRVIGHLKEDESRVLLLESLTEDDSLKSLQVNTKTKIDYPKLMSCIIGKSHGLPAAIVTLAKSLSRVIKRNDSKEVALSKEQKKGFEEFILSSAESGIGPDRNNPVLCLAYEFLRHDDTLNRATVACLWHSLDFYEHSGSVNYRDLIANWILEGYLDPVWSVAEAYQEGHSILMELIERGFLKIQEDNMVVPEMAMRNLIHLQDFGFFERSRLGFCRVYGGDKTKGLGKITLVDDMIKTVPSKDCRLSTMLVSGNRLRRAIPGKLFPKQRLEGQKSESEGVDLEVLGLFNPAFDDLVPSLSKLKKLRVLVIRDFDLLQSIDDLAGLEELHVLEVSGASSLESISNDFFKTMKQLQSLNLSGLRIKSSPTTISQLSELRCLIMRDCPELEDLPDMQGLTKLEAIDVRGARELKTCFDRAKGKEKNKSKNKNFAHLQRLQHLDLSRSQIDRLPIFQDSAHCKTLGSLTRLLLRGCNKLRRLPILKPLSGLQILDLSGATSVQEMYEVCFEDKEELRILNLSGTNLRELPDTINGLCRLRQFLLRNCQMLGALPNIENLKNLEVFDVSGCTKMEKIEGSFHDMSYLRELDLSGTKLKALPELPKQSSLCSSKRLVLPDSRSFEGDDWSKIEEDLKSSGAMDQTRKILEKKSEAEGKPVDEPRVACICPVKRGECKAFVHHCGEYKSVYLKTRNFIDPRTQSLPELIEIHGSDDPSGFPDQVKEILTKAEFVSFVDSNSPTVSSIFEAFKMKSVKGCWLERCKEMETLFVGEDERHVESLEILSVSNLPKLKSICSDSLPQSSFKNLKKLSVDCCPSIKTLFPASHLPTKLEILRTTFCDNLEKVIEPVGEAPNPVDPKLPNLKIFTKVECPNLRDTKETLKALT